MLRHAVRNSSPVVVTLPGLPSCCAPRGAVVSEIVFNINGLGMLIQRAISQRDQITIIGVSVVSIAIYLLAGIIVDVAVALIDPRLQPE